MEEDNRNEEVFSDKGIKHCADEMYKINSVVPGELKKYNGRIIAESRTEGYWIFRGQTYDHGSLRAGVYRTDNILDQIVREAKRLEMDQILSKVPYAGDSILKIPPVAISQHYGLRTDYLDFTGSMNVALFFATCQWDPESRRYRPLSREEIKEHPIGIIYMTLLGDVPRDRLEIIGISSVNRPSYQYGYMIRDDGESLGRETITAIKFRQSTWLSNEMFRLFDSGELIMPSQDVTILSKIMDKMNESKVVNKPLFLSVCRQKGLKGTDEELIAWAKGYEMADEIRFLNPKTIEQIVSGIKKYDYDKGMNAEFIIRPHYATS